MGFLLRKSTHGKYLDSYKLKPVKTNYFRKKLKSVIDELHEKYNNNDIKIKNFHDDDENAVSILDVNEYNSIKNTIEQILQSLETNPIESLKSMKRVNYSAMLFDMPEEKSLITIDTVSIFNKAFDKFGLVATYDEIGLQELEKDSLLIFGLSIPCIYFEEEEKLLVLDRAKTEKIFNLIEHYQEKANEKFEELENEEIIELDKGVLTAELKNITTARRIDKMIKGNLFTTDIEIYKKHDEYLKKHPEIDDELTQLIIKNNKVVLDTQDRIKSFLHITSMNIVNPVIDNSQTYISFQKRKVKTKS